MKAKFWHWAGVGLSFIGVAYLSQRLMVQANELLLSGVSTASWWMIGALSLLYGASNGFLARAWWELLFHQQAAPGWASAARIYGLSQLAKYVPGNLFHLVGRQAMGLAQGIPGWALAKAAGLELLSLVVGACLFAIWLIRLAWPTWSFEAATVLFCVCLVALVVVIVRLGSLQLARAFVGHCLFLGSSAAIFVATFGALSEHPITLQAAALLGASYVVAWLAGLATPGAPAGLGVREAAILLLLEGSGLPTAEVLLAVLVTRCITIVGDVMFFGAAWRIPAGPSLSRRERAAADI